MPKKVPSKSQNQTHDTTVLPTQFVNNSKQIKAIAPPLTDFITISNTKIPSKLEEIQQSISVNLNSTSKDTLTLPSNSTATAETHLIINEPALKTPINGLPGCVLNLNFVAASAPPPKLDEGSTTEEEEDSEDEYVDPYLYVIENYGDLMDELYVKPSRWRLVYERTGRMEFKFRGSKRMGCQIEDICKSKLKFVDESKTQLNVKNSTNNLILMYQSKKLAVAAPNAAKQTTTTIVSTAAGATKVSSKTPTTNESTNQAKPQLNSKLPSSSKTTNIR